MAQDEGEERSEEATGKKKQEARSKGQVAKSKELVTFIMMLAASLILYYMGGYLGTTISDIVKDSLTISRIDIFDPATPYKALTRIFDSIFRIVFPIGGLLMITAFFANIALSGFVFSTESLKPKFSKLNPIKGMKKFISPNSLMELMKALVKFLIPGAVLVSVLWYYADDFITMSDEPLEQMAAHVWEIASITFLLCSISLIVIALVDVPFQLWQFNKQLKMTKTEVKDERKQADGNPQIKAKIRSKQFEMAMQRMMQQVPNADVVITNPMHFAVALRYDQDKDNAPVLLAKGTELVAANIRMLATSASIPLVTAPLLARAIYHSTELNQPIPEGLYTSVAKVLAYIFQLRTAKKEGGPKPTAPSPNELPVPNKYIKK